MPAITKRVQRGRPTESPCAITRTLEVVGERWTFLILRDALAGVTRFADFRQSLGVAPDVLTDRLTTLVLAGVMEKLPYQEPGSRARFGYHLTAAGRALRITLGALQQWGDEHRPCQAGPTVVRPTVDGNRPVHVSFVDDTGTVIPAEQVAFVRTAIRPPDAD